MAKIKCENCGAKYNGNFCPICSTPAPEQPQKKKKNGFCQSLSWSFCFCWCPASQAVARM